MRKLEVFAWGMYDLANTLFSALFVTFFYPIYIKHFLGGSEFQVGMVFSLSMLLVALLVPSLGAVSDAIGRRKPFIFFFTLLCCVFTYFVAWDGLPAALIFGLVANFAYHAALTTYNALQTHVSSPEEYGLVSGIGVGLGYMGTLLALGIASFYVLPKYGWETLEGTVAIFIMTAVLFFTLSLFLFFGVYEPAPKKRKGFAAVWREMRSSMHETLFNLHRNRPLVRFLLGLFAYVNAITAVIIFLALYAKSQFQLEIQSFMLVYAVFSVAAAVGSFVFARSIDRLGPRTVLLRCGIAWMFTILLLIAVPFLAGPGASSGLSVTERLGDIRFLLFLLAGSVGGASMGIVWASSRPMLLALAPRKKVGQYFGFMELVSKFSGVVGPAVFGALATYLSYTWALASLLVFFAVGLFYMRLIPDARPRSR